jgi:hypothetical protein
MMPWEKPSVQAVDDLTIPAFLKRDANNVAPWMLKTENKNEKSKQPDFPWQAVP